MWLFYAILTSQGLLAWRWQYWALYLSNGVWLKSQGRDRYIYISEQKWSSIPVQKYWESMYGFSWMELFFWCSWRRWTYIEIDWHAWIGRFGFRTVVGTRELEPLLEGNSIFEQRCPDLCCNMSQILACPVAHPACFCLPWGHPDRIFGSAAFSMYFQPHWFIRGWVRSYPKGMHPHHFLSSWIEAKRFFHMRRWSPSWLQHHGEKAPGIGWNGFWPVGWGIGSTRRPWNDKPWLNTSMNTYDMNAAWAYTWKKQETLSSRSTGWFLWGRCIPYIGQPPLAIFSLTGPEPFRFLKLKKTIPSKWRLFSPSMSNLGCAINFTERVTLKYWGKTRSNGGGGHFVKNNKK